MGWPKLPKRDPQATQPPNGEQPKTKSKVKGAAKADGMPDVVDGPANGPDIIQVPKGKKK